MLATRYKIHTPKGWRTWAGKYSRNPAHAASYGYTKACELSRGVVGAVLHAGGVRMTAPTLEPWCGSWIITRRADGRAVLETFSRRVVDAVNLELYNVETAAQYLGRINEEIRAGSTAYNA